MTTKPRPWEPDAPVTYNPPPHDNSKLRVSVCSDPHIHNMKLNSTKPHLASPSTSTATAKLKVFLAVSLLIHILEICSIIAVLVRLFTADVTSPASLQVSVLAFFLLPSVVSNLISAIFYLRRRVHGSSSSPKAESTVVLALIHAFQLGIFWRHLQLWREKYQEKRRILLVELLVLKLSFAVISTLPELGIQLFVVIWSKSYAIVPLVAMFVCLLSASWSLSVFSTDQSEADQKNNLGLFKSLLKLLWKLGETAARVLCLVIFTTKYGYWIILVLIGHMLVTMICGYTKILGTTGKVRTASCTRFICTLGISYVYMFNFVEFDSKRRKIQLAIYYIIMFFENTVLLISVILQTTDFLESDLFLFVVVAAGCFVVSMCAMIVSNVCFGKQGKNKFKQEKHTVKFCTCEIKLCSQHKDIFPCSPTTCQQHKEHTPCQTNAPTKQQNVTSCNCDISKQKDNPPCLLNATSLNNYQAALQKGNYFKNVLHDTYFDSDRGATDDERDVKNIRASLPSIPEEKSHNSTSDVINDVIRDVTALQSRNGEFIPNNKRVPNGEFIPNNKRLSKHRVPKFKRSKKKMTFVNPVNTINEALDASPWLTQSRCAVCVSSILSTETFSSPTIERICEKCVMKHIQKSRLSGTCSTDESSTETMERNNNKSAQGSKLQRLSSGKPKSSLTVRALEKLNQSNKLSSDSDEGLDSKTTTSELSSIEPRDTFTKRVHKGDNQCVTSVPIFSPWYVCSESEDSAIQRTLSVSSLNNSDSDELEMII